MIKWRDVRKRRIKKIRKVNALFTPSSSTLSYIYTSMDRMIRPGRMVRSPGPPHLWPLEGYSKNLFKMKENVFHTAQWFLASWPHSQPPPCPHRLSTKGWNLPILHPRLPGPPPHPPWMSLKYFDPALALRRMVWARIAPWLLWDRCGKDEGRGSQESFSPQYPLSRAEACMGFIGRREGRQRVQCSRH